MKSTKSLKITLVFILSFCALFLFSDSVYAEDGVAVTGSFTTYEYTIVKGETLDCPIVDIIFFNNYSHNVFLHLSFDSPEGISASLDEQIITLEANSHLSIPIVITVDNNVSAGEHSISINAKLIDNTSDGQTNIGVDYVLQSKVHVVELSSQLNVNILDIKDQTISSKIYLYHITDNGKSPAGYSNTGVFNGTLSPGQYEITAYYSNYQIVSKQISLESNSILTENLKAETVIINNFELFAQYDEEDYQKLKAINIFYNLENIYADLENVRITLSVFKDDILIEEKDINNYDILAVNTYEANYQHISDSNFEEGQYKFVLKSYIDSIDSSGKVVGSLQCSQSPTTEINVYSPKTSLTDIIDIRIILLVSLLGSAIGLYLLFRFISKKMDPDIDGNDVSPALDTAIQSKITSPDQENTNQQDENAVQDTVSEKMPTVTGGKCSACNDEEQMLCPECGGSGKTEYGALEEECIYCSGIGVVLCASCVNRKHLRVCPRCNGDSFTQTANQKVECTFCNSLGYLLVHQHAKYINDKKVKLGTKGKNNNKK